MTMVMDKLLELWLEFEEIPLDENSCIEEVFEDFGIGTDVYHIHAWFEEEQNELFICEDLML